MKILQVGKFYYPSHGGIETMLRNLSEGLAEKDQVTVVCSSDTRERIHERINGVEILRSACLGRLFSQPLAFSLPRDFARLAREADVIHVHSPNPLAETAALTMKIGVPGGKPLVVSYHSDIVRQRAFLPFYGPLLRAFLRKTTKVVVATENHIHHSPFLTQAREKCVVIPYGIIKKEYALDTESFRRTEKLRAVHGKFVLFVGRLVGYKGVPVLIEAFKALKDLPFKCVIVGDGPLKPELEKLARNLGVEGKVRFAGAVPQNEILSYFHASEALVLPSISKNEAFGLVQVEAMACAKPCITTRLDSGITLVNIHEVTGLQVAAEDPAELAQAIRKLLEDDALRARMGASGRKRFEEHFTREKMVASYRDLYRSIES